MHKIVALCLIVLSLVHSSVSSACTASAIVVETPGQWQEGNEFKRVFEIHLQNTHAQCAISDSVTLAINPPPGTTVSHSWGMANGQVTGVALAAGQTYSGPGFVLNGPGTPTVSVTSIQTCSCGNDPTLSPSNPTSLPSGTSAPTDAPTGQPTNPPTNAPTNSPSDTPTNSPTSLPTDTPTGTPTGTPTNTPSDTPTSSPSSSPTTTPTGTPGPTSSATVAPTIAPSGTYYTLGFRVALFTCTKDDIRLSVAQLINNAVGSQYDVISADTWGTAALSLTNSDGSGKYYAFVSTKDLTCWSADQQTQIANYENTFHIKMVVLYTYPANGVTPAIAGTAVVTADAATLNFAPSLQSSTKALVYEAEIPVPGGVNPEAFTIYAYPASITDSTIATPAVYINFKGEQYVAGAIVKLSNPTRTHLEFYLDQADWAVYPIILGTAWFEWVTNGLFAGARRIEFNCHTDDVFMFTGMFDNVTGAESEDDNNRARIVPSDLEDTLAWQLATNEALPAGSNFTITFPYNYGTVEVDLGGYENDPLFLRAMQRDILDNFIWESHTYDHPYLDNLTYAKVTSEYTKNVPGILKLFGVESVDEIPNYCKKSTITPSISGLFNGNAIRAMLDFGFQFVVGDNSRAELLPTFPYHTLHSNETNGYSGLIIVPRHATNIYYDACMPIHVTEQYDHFYESKFGHSTLDQIVNRDVEVAMRALLAYRHDPFMFHQANMVWNTTTYPDGKKHCLLSYWSDQVLGALTSYSSLPVISRTHDQLGQMFLDREARDACGFAGTLKFDNATHAAVGLSASATGTCVYGVSGAQASGSNVLTYETYGPETTTWFSIPSNTLIIFCNNIPLMIFDQMVEMSANTFYVDFAQPVNPL